MPNSYFRFRQFTVQQDKCAMKVCTDACLFGAWVASKQTHGKILDIGAGTGLLSLMLAQKSSSIVHAVEIDALAAEQAAENFLSSPWKSRLRISETRIQDFGEEKYDLVISNPPFFFDDLKGADTRRNAALHDDSLPMVELFFLARKHTVPNGLFALLAPFHRAPEVEKHAIANQFNLKEKIFVRQTPGHEYFRAMYLFSATSSDEEKIVDEIVIKDQSGGYSEKFQTLLADYYLSVNKNEL